jgi:hypothetical protein
MRSARSLARCSAATLARFGFDGYAPVGFLALGLQPAQFGKLGLVTLALLGSTLHFVKRVQGVRHGGVGAVLEFLPIECGELGHLGKPAADYLSGRWHRKPRGLDNQTKGLFVAADPLGLGRLPRRQRAADFLFQSVQPVADGAALGVDGGGLRLDAGHQFLAHIVQRGF